MLVGSHYRRTRITSRSIVRERLKSKTILISHSVIFMHMKLVNAKCAKGYAGFSDWHGSQYFGKLCSQIEDFMLCDQYGNALQIENVTHEATDLNC